MDSQTFCEVLGAQNANDILQAHWDGWVTEAQLQALVDRDVTLVRLPIGDWTLSPYGPYIGCMDGAADRIQWLLDTALKVGLKVLLDIHALKGSQNGSDNSGQTSDVVWTSDNTFNHWSHNNSHWMGK